MSYFIELKDLTDNTISKSSNFKKLRSKNNKKLFGNEHEFDFNANIKKIINILCSYEKYLVKLDINYFDIETEIEVCRDGYIKNIYTVILMLNFNIIGLRFIIYTNICLLN